jgi:hypothetical protein
VASQNPERLLDGAVSSFPTRDWLAGPDDRPTQVKALNDQAERCRRLAQVTFNREVSDMLGDMADDYEQRAQELSRTRSA